MKVRVMAAEIQFGRMSGEPMRNALIVVDVQGGFDSPKWGRSDNPHFEVNVAALVSAWQQHGQPIVYVRHDSVHADSPLRPGQSGNDLKPFLAAEPDPLVVKTVNSAFYGTPDLHAWLQADGIAAITICGVQTNFCAETTARMGGNLGYDVTFILDATQAFDMRGPAGEHKHIPAEQVRLMTATNLNGEFATVTKTEQTVAALQPA